jgi:hypothetical protein
VEVDPPLAVLQSTPVSYRRAAALRLTAWTVAAFIALAAVGHHAAAQQDLHLVPVVTSGICAYLLASAVSFLLAMLLGSYVGGGVALGALGLLTVLGRAWHGDPLQLLAAPPMRFRPAEQLAPALIGFILAGLAFYLLSPGRRVSWNMLSLQSKLAATGSASDDLLRD